MSDVTAYYQRINNTNEALCASKKRGERDFEPDDACWLVSCNQEDLGPAVGGRNGVACLVALHDRGGVPRAARSLCEPGKPFRLAVQSDFEPGGAVFENLRQQQASLAARKLIDEKLEGKNKSFMVRVPGEA